MIIIRDDETKENSGLSCRLIRNCHYLPFCTHFASGDSASARVVACFDWSWPDSLRVALLPILPCHIHGTYTAWNMKHHVLRSHRGSSENAPNIDVNNHTLQISRNLHAFLMILHGQVKYESQWFWADQISMNQEDVEERNHQVSHMGQIYSDASRVFGYLGDEPNPSILDAKAFSMNPLSGANPSKTKIILTLLDLYDRQYWKRLWVIQELRLAAKAVFWCGKFSIRRDILYWNLVQMRFEIKKKHLLADMDGFAAKHVHERTGAVYGEQGSMIISLLEWPRLQDGQGLQGVLSRYCRSLCSDRRDKVFGLQMLVHADERISVDYSKSFEEIMHDLHRTIVTLKINEDNFGPTPQEPIWEPFSVGLRTRIRALRKTSEWLVDTYDVQTKTLSLERSGHIQYLCFNVT